MVAQPMTDRSPPVPRLLWSLAWFWLGAGPALPLFYPGNLYWVTAVSILVSVSLGIAAVSVWLVGPLRPRSAVAKWVFGYLAWVGFVSALSPYVAQNWLRTEGFLLATGSMLLSIIVGSCWLRSDHALIAAGRAYVFGVTVPTVSLILLGVQASIRFGNDEVLHPNALGFMFALALLFILFLPLYRNDLLRIAAVLGFAILLVLTFSKTVLIAMLVAVGVATLFQRGWRKAKFILALLTGGGLVLVLTGDYLQQQMETYTTNPYLVQTLTGRTILWRWTLDMVKERPWVGYGFATFRDIFSPYSLGLGFLVPATQAHNAYLDALFTGGLIGLLLFLLTVFSAVMAIARRTRGLQATPWASFLISTMVLILIRSLTESMLNLGRDFTILICMALLAEQWPVKVWLVRHDGQDADKEISTSARAYGSSR